MKRVPGNLPGLWPYGGGNLLKTSAIRAIGGLVKEITEMRRYQLN